MIKIKLIFCHHYFKLTDPASWLSWIIRLKSNCDLNHIEWSVKNKGVEEVTGATSRGVITRTYENFIKERPYMHAVTYEIEITKREYKNLLDGKGKKYDFSSIGWHGIQWITKKWYGEKGIAAKGKLNCSEYIAAALNETLNMENPHMATSADILEAVLK